VATIDKYLNLVLRDGASDLHIHAGRQPRYRLGGNLVPMPGTQAIEAMPMFAMLHEICPGDKWAVFEATGDLDFAHSHTDGSRFRVNYSATTEGPAAVFRAIPPVVPNLAQIGAPEALKRFADFQSGLLLVTGPTGSGKSTTLAALIDHINATQRKFIVTIEDPIEFVHPMKQSTVAQREVGEDARSFSEALRNAVRQDTQVILVGEMRDLETVRLAVTAAEMGMLVFATLHTNSAVKTVDRIVDVFPADEQANVRESLANVLRAVCSQRLLKRADGNGRIAAHEILFQTPAVANLIRESKTNQIPQVILSGRAMGMQLLDDVLTQLAESGVIEWQEAYRKATEKDRFAHMVKE
jgi:twitching motility protein PilT